MIDAFCQSCGARFDVPKDKAGAIVNCPECGKAVEVEGTNDLLWTLTKIGTALVVVVAVSAIVAPTFGANAAALVSAVILGLLWVGMKVAG